MGKLFHSKIWHTQIKNKVVACNAYVIQNRKYDYPNDQNYRGATNSIIFRLALWTYNCLLILYHIRRHNIILFYSNVSLEGTTCEFKISSITGYSSWNAFCTHNYGRWINRWLIDIKNANNIIVWIWREECEIWFRYTIEKFSKVFDDMCFE